MSNTRPVPNDGSDSFIEVSFKEVTAYPARDLPSAQGEKDDEIYDNWKNENSHAATDAGMAFTNILRKKHPGWSVVRVGNPYMFPFLGFPDLLLREIPGETMDSQISGFIPFVDRSHVSGGMLLESIKCGGFLAAWKSFDFRIYQVVFPSGMFTEQNLFILHEGDVQPIFTLLISIAAWGQDLHEEVLIYDQGFWQKSRSLYYEIQKANWSDVILKDKFKKAIQGDVKNFFKSEDVYKEIGAPWKRGLIFYGPAGNGKTISLKAAMHDANRPILYVRTLTNYRGDEAAMADIFGMARRFAPCILVLEDIDSHINDRNRSFFLNQLDGLDNNEGILLLATTNHLERLDNSISGRPSRFDRKYLFDDPDEEERRLYCRYWQRKLENNSRKITFPDCLVDEIARDSDGLSFAYLKEAFVATLVLLAGDDDLDFAETLKAQVKELKDQIKHCFLASAAERTFPITSSQKIGELSELGHARNVLGRFAGEDRQKGLTMEYMRGIPTPNMSLKRWM